MNNSYNYNAASDDTFSDDGIFLRPSDRDRFDYVMRSLRDNHVSLALSSDNDGVLDHYGRMVVSRLRKSGNLQVEVFQPKNTEQLLQRLNQILSGISFDDALKFEGSPSAHRVLVAEDAKSIVPRDLELLARLVEDFPGANVSLVLIFDREGMQIHEGALDSFGQRLLRWPVDAPTREEGDALLAAARAVGLEVDARKLLAATGYAEEPPPPFHSNAAFDPDAPFDPDDPIYQNNPFREDGPGRTGVFENQDGRTEPSFFGELPHAPVEPPEYVYPDEESPEPRTGMSSLLRWSLTGVAVVVVTVAAVLILVPGVQSRLAGLPLLKQLWPAKMPDSKVAITEAPTKSVTPSAQPKPAPAELAAPAPTPATTAGSENSSLSAAAAPDPATATVPPAPVKAPVPAEEKVAPAKAAPSAAETPKPAAKPSAGNADSPPAQAPKPATKAASKPAVTVTAEDSVSDAKPAKNANTAKAEPGKQTDKAQTSQSERGTDQAIRKAPADSVFVQHASLASMADAQAWRTQHPALSKAKIVAVNTRDKGIRYAVISGPFASRKDAEEFAARDGVPTGPWLRPQKLLQAALLPAKR